MAELKAFVLVPRETLLVVAIVVAATTVVTELVMLALTMLTVTIVAIIVSSVQPMAPALVDEMLQFASVEHPLQQLTPLRQ